ncbi:DYW domain [Dillenia turbinata]|uniref:DYW domain n=1 Tax=Dillenia turbinata TaxID=194707 RepID=A0AAN8VKH8_9MAGN
MYKSKERSELECLNGIVDSGVSVVQAKSSIKQPVDDDCEMASGQYIRGIGQSSSQVTSQSATSYCPSPDNSLSSAILYAEAKQIFTNTEASDCVSSAEKSGESADVNNSDYVESRKTSIDRGSTGSDVSDESSSAEEASKAQSETEILRSHTVRADPFHTHLANNQQGIDMIWRTLSKCFGANELTLLGETCLPLISFCNSRSLKEGVCVHGPILKLCLQDQLFLNNNLLTLYAKCFGVRQARQFFDEMPYRDVVSWTGMLSAYAKGGCHNNVVELFGQMVIFGQCPNEFTLSSVLRSCSAVEDCYWGTRVHSYMVKLGFEANEVLCSALINLYSKCDYVEEAQKLFAPMNAGDVFTWTTMISSLIQSQRYHEALYLYFDMIRAGVNPNEFTFVKLLGASSHFGLDHVKFVHAHLIIWGVDLNVVLKTALVDVYGKCQKMDDALKVVNQTNEYDVSLWTAIISGFCQNANLRDALARFREMKIYGISPNDFTYSVILSVCSSLRALDLAKQVHSQVMLLGLENNEHVGNSLVDMYMKCSDMTEDAIRAFNGISSPNVISWTSLIAGLSEHGLEEDSLKAFMDMVAAGVKPNSYTLSTILGACSKIRSKAQTEKLHGFVIKTKADDDINVGNALVDAYAGLGQVDDAWLIIGRMSRRDAITYTSLATRLNQLGHHKMALSIISSMCSDNIKMDGFSMASFLSASASLSAVEPGKLLHCYSFKSGLGSYVSVSNGLVNLYGKCGLIEDTWKAFKDIREPDVVSWNGLMQGSASYGHFDHALSTFEDMQLAGVKPDSVTFSLVLSSCSSGGFPDLGLQYFRSMSEVHNMVPHLDHYVCLVDLLGRAARLHEAVDVINSMPLKPNAQMYKTLLAACRSYGHVTLGEEMASEGLRLDPYDPAFYVLLAELYDLAGRPDLGEKARRLMRERGLKTSPDQSWVEVRNEIHHFVACDRSHPQIHLIHQKIESLILELENLGYSHKKNENRLYDSDKLALAFGLLNMPSRAAIRIIKNRGISLQCHEFMKTVSGLVDREIILKGGCFHFFKKGGCSCKNTIGHT